MAERKPLMIPIILLVLLYVVSVVYFHFVEGWAYLDAAYFTTSTISTVGYGDFIPVTDHGKIGAILLTFGGVGLAIYVITHLGILREKKVDPHVQRRLEMLRSFTMHSSGLKKSDLKRLRKKLKERAKQTGKR